MLCYVLCLITGTALSGHPSWVVSNAQKTGTRFVVDDHSPFQTLSESLWPVIVQISDQTTCRRSGCVYLSKDNDTNDILGESCAGSDVSTSVLNGTTGNDDVWLDQCQRTTCKQIPRTVMDWPLLMEEVMIREWRIRKINSCNRQWINNGECGDRKGSVQ